MTPSGAKAIRPGSRRAERSPARLRLRLLGVALVGFFSLTLFAVTFFSLIGR